jgi:type IV pilus assembly protein PilW
MRKIDYQSMQLPSRCHGLTLVEIMVAITISLILLAGILTILNSSKTTYRTTEAISRSQENGRYALNIMSQRVRTAGYVGCSTGNIGAITNTLNNSATDNRFNYGIAIEGYEANGTGLAQTYPITATYPSVSASASDWTATAGTSTDLPADLLGDGVIPGTDVLVVRAALDKGAKIDRNNNSAQLFIDATDVITNGCPNGTDDMVNGLCKGDILVATDCSKSVVFQATNITTTGGGSCTSSPCANVVHSNSGSFTPGNAVSSWGGSSSDTFGSDGEILQMVTSVFYIGVGANGSPALFLKENDALSQELIDNVESMQVLYGEDTNATTPVTASSTPAPSVATRFVTAAQVTDWDRIVSARVSLLLRTATLVRSDNDTASYTLTGGSVINPVDDRRIRHIYTATIKLRNKGLR